MINEKGQFFLNFWLIFDKELELDIKRTSAYVELAQFPTRVSVFQIFVMDDRGIERVQRAENFD